MADVLLFHHALGLTPGVETFAELLRAAGHDVRTPDLFEGRLFDDIDSGVAHASEIGFGTIMRRGAEAAEGTPPGAVYIGFSLGVVPAQRLAQTTPGAGGAVLVSACLPVSEFGEEWPAGVPVRVVATEADPFFVDEGDIDAARQLVEASPDAELLLLPGSAHLFADPGHESYDAEAAGVLTDHVLALLAQVDAAAGRG
ncbi:dienelactone hydrolase family protein [Sanguibacter sp. 4.1]|uniref:Dienelactone hydrolase family protein n=1 Tax=Sanguibacter biliveldensis TaxID=3030830 RepID=A0AAF0Z463_9MICO|nr:dienelactone hydrolase family protein [Sanguibacter sp. 4.1]WPF83050.1 dienelactone hydrolase family protein [Sanguibacter sp. 4.1]